MLQINDVLSNIKDVMKYSIEYMEKPTNIKYTQPLSSFSINGLYNIKSISISKKDISKFNNYINSIKTAIENGDLDAILDTNFKVKVSIDFNSASIEENLEYDITTSTDTITINRKMIMEKVNILKASRSEVNEAIDETDSFDIIIKIYDGDDNNRYFIKLYSSYINYNSVQERFDPIISINNKAGYIRITRDDYENSISNTKCLKIGNDSYVKSFDIGKCTNKDSEDYDFNILFATADCRVTYFGNTYPSGIDKNYSDRLPLASLYQCPMHLNVNTSGLLYEDTDEVMESVQTLAIYHVVTNSSGNSRNALSEFERSMHYKNGEVTIDKWVHLNTYDTDGKSYSFSGNSFDPK